MADPATHATTRSPQRRRTGRRPGNPDTRQAVIDAARTVFADHGYTRATIRSIAGVADVDAALVHHYFGSKKDLFLATVAVPVDPGELLGRLAAGGLDGLGGRLIGTVLTVWDSPAQPALLAALRMALDDPHGSRLMREFLATEIIARLLADLGFTGREAVDRGALVASQLIGLIVGRYLLAVPGLADAPVSRLVERVGPTIQRYLTDQWSP